MDRRCFCFASFHFARWENNRIHLLLVHPLRASSVIQIECGNFLGHRPHVQDNKCLYAEGNKFCIKTLKEKKEIPKTRREGNSCHYHVAERISHAENKKLVENNYNLLFSGELFRWKRLSNMQIHPLNFNYWWVYNWINFWVIIQLDQPKIFL